MKTTLQQGLMSLDQTTELIRSGVSLSIAGPEAVLDQLPAGPWIGGTSSYFTTEAGGGKSATQLFVTELPADGPVRIEHYPASHLHKALDDAPENGFSFAILPSGTPALTRFSQESRFWPDSFIKPIVGWVAGIDLVKLGQQKPAVYHGPSGTKFADGMVVIHVPINVGRLATIETINIFNREPAHVIRFPTTGDRVDQCTVNGQPTRLSAFFAAHGNADGKLPLIGDFAGANINVSVRAIDTHTGGVSLYAPVFPDVEYYLAQPVANYPERFAREIAKRKGSGTVFSCNCILNYLYGDLEGKPMGALQGPVTFGEIAYLLHNQTMVILTID